jgi:hypothetical protein
MRLRTQTDGHGYLYVHGLGHGQLWSTRAVASAAVFSEFKELRRYRDSETVIALP